MYDADNPSSLIKEDQVMDNKTLLGPLLIQENIIFGKALIFRDVGMSHSLMFLFII